MKFEVTAEVLNCRHGIVGDEGEVKRPWAKILYLNDENTTGKDGFTGRDTTEWRIAPDNDNAIVKQLINQVQLPSKLVLVGELRKSGKEQVPFCVGFKVIK